MNVGDLIRYKKWPHEELHDAGLTGIVLTNPYVMNPNCRSSREFPVVDVMWSNPSAWGGSQFVYEYIDEIEYVP